MTAAGFQGAGLIPRLLIGSVSLGAGSIFYLWIFFVGYHPVLFAFAFVLVIIGLAGYTGVANILIEEIRICDTLGSVLGIKHESSESMTPWDFDRDDRDSIF
jgi:hypothetical protein